MVKSTYYHLMFTRLVFLLSSFTLLSYISCTQPLCHEYERNALLQLKKSFVIDEFSSGDSKLDSWQNGTNCCLWDGVECNEESGYVIGLDVSNSFLYGSINSKSSLFLLIHLRSLNLSDNYFNHSAIPAEIKNLSGLTLLDLSFSSFSGQIPFQVLQLSKLRTLDLSGNPLELQTPSLRNLADKLANLRQLFLDGVLISSTLPENLMHLSSLTYLSLEDCGLHGQFPRGIFQLPDLQYLNVQDNPYLTGQLPEFNTASPLQFLSLTNTSFTGKLPESMGNLQSLLHLDIRNCNFTGSLPSSMSKLTKLNYLALSYNNFSGQIPLFFTNFTQLTVLSFSSSGFSVGTLSWLGKLTKLSILSLGNTSLQGDIPSSLENLTQLTYLALALNKLTGQIPSGIGNLTKLTYLSLYSNQLTGPIPSSLGNLTQLNYLDLSINKLQGPFPESIFGLVNLQVLYLHMNFLSDTLKLESFLINLKNLTQFQLSGSGLSLLTNITVNVSAPKFILLGLGYCNISEFPEFLRNQDELVFLELAGNKIHGQIPRWFWEMNKASLSYLGLAANFLTGFDQSPAFLPWTGLRILHLESNKLQASLPIPPPSLFDYYLSNNSLTGDISPLICNLSSIIYLDLSSNNFSGALPQCLANLSQSLVALDLRNNSFTGSIPQMCTKGSSLRMIDVSQNLLQGQLPRSLADCDMLETLILGNNRIIDTFPSWLGVLPELRILILRNNGFHDAIEEPKTDVEFPKLQILDLSVNRFSGNLSSQYFQTLNAMKALDAGNLSYLQAHTGFQAQSNHWDNYFGYTVTLTNKGIVTEYDRIQDFLVAIDLSSNEFKGFIPEEIGNLKALNLLNISNNFLSGPIPSSIGNLKNLESLDFSHNNLSGHIPQQLVELTFLVFLNVSDNHLTGPIPQGKQFDTFQNDSFDGNPGLCGSPLSKNCGDSAPSIPSSEEDAGGKSFIDFGWKIVLIGYASGLIIGVFIGNAFFTRKHEWLFKFFRMRPPKRIQSVRSHMN